MNSLILEVFCQISHVVYNVYVLSINLINDIVWTSNTVYLAYIVILSLIEAIVCQVLWCIWNLLWCILHLWQCIYVVCVHEVCWCYRRKEGGCVLKASSLADALLYYATHSPHSNDLFSAIKPKAWARARERKQQKQKNKCRTDSEGLIDIGGHNWVSRMLLMHTRNAPMYWPIKANICSALLDRHLPID